MGRGRSSPGRPGSSSRAPPDPELAGVYDLAEAHGALEKPLGLAATIPAVNTIIDGLLTMGVVEIIKHKQEPREHAGGRAEADTEEPEH